MLTSYSLHLQICPHDRIKYKCKDCGGKGVCVHGRRKNQCLECGGSQMCVHGRRKYRYALCMLRLTWQSPDAFQSTALRISCTSLYHCLTRRETQVQRMWRQIHLPTRSAKGPVQGLWRFPDMRAQSRAQQVRCMWWRFYLPAFAPEGPVQRLQSDAAL